MSEWTSNELRALREGIEEFSSEADPCASIKRSSKYNCFLFSRSRSSLQAKARKLELKGFSCDALNPNNDTTALNKPRASMGVCCMRAVCEQGSCENFIKCPSNHAVCRECMSGYIRMKTSEGAELQIPRAAKIFCPLKGHGCDSDTYYSDQDLKANLDKEMYAIYKETEEK